ncbi:hypothetical protein Scep_002409 [Stephania cephalantha]|uniref:RNase H type-1 domain-containing protein n=1 Tax=Stephania cephalantha TaxID=152367 RepID=A0AAP0L9Y8_9MAGN
MDAVSPNSTTPKAFFNENIIFVDAARDLNTGRTGLGWMVRTRDGLIQKAGQAFVEFTTDVEWAELLAIRSALLNLGATIEDMLIFSDSTNAISLILGGKEFSDHDLLAKNIHQEAS